jgi:hypothetical protein
MPRGFSLTNLHLLSASPKNPAELVSDCQKQKSPLRAGLNGLKIFIANYGAGCAGVSAGAALLFAGAEVAGAVVAGAFPSGDGAGVLFSCSSILEPPVEPPLPVLAMVVIDKVITTTTANKIQVPFSRTSPVRCTPNMLLADDPVANPPPLGFWINTKIDKATQIMINRIIKKSIVCYMVKFSFL